MFKFVSMQRLFFISGLGANERAFSRMGEVGCEKIMIKWIPNDENETLKEYALRLINRYEIKNQDLVAGLSFGGLLAQKISAITGQQKVILISGFRDKNDLKFPFRLALDTGLYRLLPSIRVPYVDALAANVLNSGTADSETVLREMIRSTDYRLMKWSMEQIANTGDNTDNDLVLHNILGDRDRIVHLWKNDTTYVVNGGSHFMVYDRAEAVTGIIREILKIEK